MTSREHRTCGGYGVSHYRVLFYFGMGFPHGFSSGSEVLLSALILSFGPAFSIRRDSFGATQQR